MRDSTGTVHDAAAAARPLKVMFVEDHPDVLHMVALGVECMPSVHCTHAFTDGTDLLNELEGGSESPDIVVTDWSMPRIDGPTLIRRIKADWPAIRVIVYTAYSHRALVDSACQAGAWGVVSKSYGLEGLMAAIFEVADGRMVIKC